MSKKIDLKKLKDRVVEIKYAKYYRTRLGLIVRFEIKENKSERVILVNEEGAEWGITNNPRSDRTVRILPLNEEVLWKIEHGFMKRRD